MNTKLRVFFMLLTFLHTSTGWWWEWYSTTTTTPSPKPSTSSSICKCGIHEGNRNRIVGGQPATKNEYPWLVALVQTGSVQPFCGGTLISSRTVLTAAHCIFFSNSDIRVHVGEHDVATADGEQIIGVRSQKTHPDYNIHTLDNDFAVIELTRDVAFSKSIMPICLPNVGTNYDNKLSTAVGWGTFSYGSSSAPTIPYEVDLDSISNTACTTNTQYNPGMITSNMICAREPGKDSCQGDSGGPLMTKESRESNGSKESNFFSLIGVVSWGEGCAKSNAPGVYARVTSKMGWIKDEMKGISCPKP